VSVHYLTKPIDVFKEMCRVLKPGGLAIMRKVPSKACQHMFCTAFVIGTVFKKQIAGRIDGKEIAHTKIILRFKYEIMRQLGL
ncbi:hypothetical protein MKX01_037071, partial [Papaver californicum]